MVTVKSRILGTVEVDETKQLVHFEDGLLGFEDFQDYYLLDMDEEGFFQVFQSKDDEDLAFVVMTPAIVFEEYKPNIHDDDVQALDIKSEEDAIIFVILTIPEEMKNMTANLQGPIVINKNTHRARQCIVLNDNYGTKHKVFEEDSVPV